MAILASSMQLNWEEKKGSNKLTCTVEKRMSGQNDIKHWIGDKDH